MTSAPGQLAVAESTPSVHRHDRPAVGRRQDRELFQAISPQATELAYLMCADQRRAHDVVRTAITEALATATSGDVECIRDRALTYVITYTRGIRKALPMPLAEEWRREPDADFTHPGRASVPGRRVDLVSSLAYLTDHERAVTILTYLHRLSDSRIANIVRRPVARIQADRHRAILRLEAVYRHG